MSDLTFVLTPFSMNFLRAKFIAVAIFIEISENLVHIAIEFMHDIEKIANHIMCGFQIDLVVLKRID